MDKIAIKRGLKGSLTVFPLKNSAVSYSVMGEEQAVLSFEHNKQVELQIGDYIIFDNITFTLNELPTIKKISSKLFRYDCIFQAPLYELLKVNYMLFDNTTIVPQSDFSLTGDANMFVDLLVANLNRAFPDKNWKKGAVLDGEVKTLNFSNESCYSALQKIAKEYDTEYSVVDNVVNLQKVTQVSNITLEYGNTLYDIERKTIESSSVVTRLYASGSERNLPIGYAAKRLKPSNAQYLESNIDKYGVIEGQKVFDDVYPRLSLLGAGIITQVVDSLTFKDENLDFDVNEYLLPRTVAKVKFLSGQCAGYECEIKKYTHVHKEINIIANTGDESLTIPNETILPAVGDRYVLLDIQMPEAYVQAAERELLLKATEYLSENSTPKVAYYVTFSELFARENKTDIRLGNMVRLVDDQFGIDTQLRVVKLHKGIKEEHAIKIEISNTVSSSTLTRMLDDIEDNKTAIINTQKGTSQSFAKNWQQMQEIAQMVETLRTDMLVVGNVSGQFLIEDTLFSANYSSNANWLHATAGKLVHKTIPDTTSPKTWTLPAYSNSALESNSTYYLYAKCSKTGDTGTYYIDKKFINYDAHNDDYYFLVGMLSSASSGSRTLQTSYGFTAISGNQITTGCIQSPDGRVFVDLDKGKIGGNISFVSTGGEEKQLSEWSNETDKKIQETNNSIENTKIEIINQIPITWDLELVSQEGVDAFLANKNGVQNTLTYTVRFWRAGKDVTDIMERSGKVLYEFERVNMYGVDDDGVTDASWNAAHKGISSVTLTDKDIAFIGKLKVNFYQDKLEEEYKRLK